MIRHLASCPLCTEEWAALHTLSREANLLPPTPLRRPLEQALGWLGLIAPLPAWAWHALRYPILMEQPIAAWVRRLAGGWVAVAAGSMAWHLAVEGGVPETQTAIQVWRAVIFLVLLALWGGYAVLEWRLARRPGELSWVWPPAVRLIITLALVMLTLPIVHL